MLSVSSQFVLIATIGYTGSLVATGVYGASFSLASVAAVIGSFGQGASAFKEIPTLLSAGDRRKAQYFVNRGFILTFAGLLVIFIPLVGLATFSLDGLGLAFMCYLLAVALGLLGVFSAVARSYGYVFFSELQRNATWRYLAVMVLLVLAYFNGELTPFLVVLIVSISSGLAFAFGVMYFYRLEKLSFEYLNPKQLMVGLRVDSENWRIQSLQAALLNLDVILAACVLSGEELGSYFILTRVASLIALPLSVTNPVIIPVMARIAKGDSAVALSSRVSKNTLINIVGTAVISGVVCLLFTHIYAALSAGDNKSSIYFPALLILVFVQWSNTIIGPSTMAAQIFNIRSTVVRVLLAAVVVQSALVWLLGSGFGILGVVVGVAVARVIVNAAVVYLLKTRVGFNIFSGSIVN